MSAMQRGIPRWLYVSLIALRISTGIGSPLRPLATYDHSIELQADVADICWSVNDTEQEITFELHMKTIGWIAFGISPGREVEE